MDNLQDTVWWMLIGMGATAIMDVWLLCLRHLGVASQSFGLIGRWVGHMLRGKLTHHAIAKAAPIPGEMALGWLTHYAVGMVFAALLASVAGQAWLVNPSPLPAVAVGMLTVLAPWLLMQPAMGAGVVASKTPTPLKNCLRSLANHAVFGLGLYLSALLLSRLLP